MVDFVLWAAQNLKSIHLVDALLRELKVFVGSFVMNWNQSRVWPPNFEKSVFLNSLSADQLHYFNVVKHRICAACFCVGVH